MMELTALELGKKMQAKEISAVEATKAALEQIEKREGNYHSFICVCREEALKQSERVQKKMMSGELTSILAGVPMAVKDNICTKGIATTCASKMLQGFQPFYTATAVNKLENIGAVLIGKTNMDEFAMGSTTETSFFGATKNPWNTDHVPGGSSGGSATAVLAEEVFYTLGSDTGGSIRQPSSYCGITGLKPTYGRVSRYGLIAYASSLDQIGPLGKTVADVAAVYETIAGYDQKDSTSFHQKVTPIQLKGNCKGLKIGMPVEFFGKGIDPEVKSRIYEAAQVYKSLGANIEEFSMPSMKYAIPAYYIIACAEASSNLSRYDGIKYGYVAPKYDNLDDCYYQSRTEGFGEEVKRRIRIGTFVLSSGYYESYYKKALLVKAVVQKAYEDAFLKYDVILTPTAPTTAPKNGESLSEPLKMYTSDICTVSVNMAGLPALVVPCGFDQNQMPVGLQLIGKVFCEEVLLQIGYAFQMVTKYHTMKPKFQKNGG